MSGGVLLGVGPGGAVHRDFGGGRGVWAEKDIEGSLTGVVGGHEAF